MSQYIYVVIEEDHDDYEANDRTIRFVGIYKTEAQQVATKIIAALQAQEALWHTTQVYILRFLPGQSEDEATRIFEESVEPFDKLEGKRTIMLGGKEIPAPVIRDIALFESSDDLPTLNYLSNTVMFGDYTRE